MNRWSKLLSIFLILVLVLTVALTGCGKGEEPTSDTTTKEQGSDQTDQKPDEGEGGGEVTEEPKDTPKDIVLTEGQFKGKKVVIWQSFEDGDAAQGGRKRLLQEGIDEFNRITGAEVEKIITIDDPEFGTKVVTSIAAGTGPDILATVQPGDFPAWIIRGLLKPISDYVDLNQEFLYGEGGLSKPTVDRCTWNGKIYGINGAELSWRIYYNTEIFEAYGAEDPAELYKQGQWTWDKFVEIAQQLTVDTDGDGSIDIWGLSGFGVDRAAIYANGGSFTKLENGKVVFTPDAPEVIEGIQFYKDLIGKYKVMPEQFWDPNPMQLFYDGKLAMMWWGSWEMNTMVERMAGKFKIAPFPVGPKNTTGKSRDIGQASAYAITASSKNPEVAATYLAWAFVPQQDEIELSRKLGEERYGSLDQYLLAIEMTNNAFLEWDWPGLSEITGRITGADTASIAQVASEVKPEGQALIDKIIAGEYEWEEAAE